jgi:hypothetical protein
MLDLSALRRGEEVIGELPFEGAKLQIAYLRRTDIVKLREEATEEVYEQHLPVRKVNKDKLYRALCHKALKGWSDMMDDGKPLDFTADNIDFMFDNYTGFDEYVANAAQSYIIIEGFRLADAKKNLKSG